MRQKPRIYNRKGPKTMAAPSKKLAQRSLIAAALLFIVGFGAGLLSLFRVQLLHGDEYQQRAQEQQLSDTIVSADRGTIYDANGKIIAQSAGAWLIYINPSKIKSDAQKETIIKGLVSTLEVSEETVRRKTENVKYSYEKIKGQVETAQKDLVSAFIKENDLYGIVCIDPDTKRYYPYSNFASSVIGFTGSDGIGRYGLELKYNDVLTGIPGRIISAKNALAGALPNEYETTYDAQQGTSLVLTIDETIQYYLEKALEQAVIDNDARGAYGIITDVETGAIIAMSSKPDYDLNTPYTIYNERLALELQQQNETVEDDAAKSASLTNMQFRQWRNCAISDTYEPGSVFKVVTMAAALEEGVIDESFSYSCNGGIKVGPNIIHCSRLTGHGTQDLKLGLKNSCNPYFITVGQMLGSEKFYKYFEAFGFTEPTKIDLPGEATPAANVTYYTQAKLGIAELSSCAFGQTFQISPIQMISAVGAIANGGKLMQPYVVASMLDQSGNTIFTQEPTVKRQVISEKTAQTTAALMEEVVKGGTGKNAYVAGYRVAGKTGTSEKLTSDGQFIASFSGFAPADNPKLAILIIVDEPQGPVHSGGGIAAPIAGNILEQSLIYLNVEPRYTDEELSKLKATAPNVVGSTVSEAKAILANQGFTPRIVGDGNMIVSQTPAQAQTLPKNGVIVLYTETQGLSTSGTVPVLTGLTVSQANAEATNSGFNIKVTGISQNSGEVISYRQNVEAGTTAELGSTITVYFKTDTGVAD